MMGLRMKDFLGSLKNPIFRVGGLKKLIYRGDCLKRKAQFAYLRGETWQERGGLIFLRRTGYPNANYEQCFLRILNCVLKKTFQDLIQYAVTS